MSDTTEEEEPAWFLAVAEIVDQILRELCERHYDSPTQEHQLASRIAQALEGAAIGVDEWTIQIVDQELPDRGPGALERRVGADLYISVVLDKGPFEPTVSKGILVQTKWDRTVDDPRLPGQARDMLERTDDAYVWTFGPDGVASISARNVVGGVPDFETAATGGELIGAALECIAGDPDIGLDLEKPLVQAINERLEELRTRTAVSFFARRF
jgi:hypothetical protein